MDGTRLMVLEYDEASGKFVPVMPDQMKDETAGFTSPLDGMPAMWRDQWQVLRKRALAEGEPPEIAWYRANVAVADLHAKWRDKARKRFFKG